MTQAIEEGAGERARDVPCAVSRAAGRLRAGVSLLAPAHTHAGAEKRKKRGEAQEERRSARRETYSDCRSVVKKGDLAKLLLHSQERRPSKAPPHRRAGAMEHTRIHDTCVDEARRSTRDTRTGFRHPDRL